MKSGSPILVITASMIQELLDGSGERFQREGLAE
jgi:hypothetical protein